MPNKKISELDDLAEVTSDDLAVVVDLSTLTTRKTSMSTLKTYFQQDVASPKSETITITSEHLSSKSFTLTQTPLLGYNVTITPRGGCIQFLGSDFVINASSVEWGGYGLDGLLEIGDTLQVEYYY